MKIKNSETNSHTIIFIRKMDMLNNHGMVG